MFFQVAAVHMRMMQVAVFLGTSGLEASGKSVSFARRIARRPRELESAPSSNANLLWLDLGYILYKCNAYRPPPLLAFGDLRRTQIDWGVRPAFWLWLRLGVRQWSLICARFVYVR